MLGFCIVETAEKGKFHKRKQLALLNFSLEVAEGLMAQNKVVTPTPRTGKVGRPTKRKAAECNETPLKGQKAFKPLPSNVLRYDQKGHWPEIRIQQKRWWVDNVCYNLECLH